MSGMRDYCVKAKSRVYGKQVLSVHFSLKAESP